MKITEQAFIRKAVEQYATYKAKKEEEQSFAIMQRFLEDLAVACKNKGIEIINGDNFELKMV